MIIYTDNEEIEPLYDSDLQNLGKGLEKFVKIYRDKVSISEDVHYIILSHLEDIGKRLKNRQYDTLIENTNIIRYDEKEEIEFDDYPF